MNYYDFALKDLKVAETMYKYTVEYDTIVAYCAQFVEKSLKHLLELKERELLKTKDLIILEERINEEVLKVYKDFFLDIKDFYYTKRYPSNNYRETTMEDCECIYNKTLDFKKDLDTLIEKYNQSKIPNNGRDVFNIKK